MKEDFRQALIKTLPILCGYAFLGFASVSYTHLDVYKRQGYNYGFAQ